MEIISNTALISINETLIVQVVCFLIFLYIINRIMFRPLRGVMADRENHIETIKQDIVAAEEKLDSLTNQIRKRESAVKREAFAQKAKLEEAGGRQAEEIFASTHREIHASRDKAQKEVDAQILEAKTYLKEESENLKI